MALHAIQEDIKPAPSEALRASLDQHREAFGKDPYPSLAQRRENLRKLHRMVLDHREQLAKAISEDWGFRSPSETEAIEILPLSLDIKDTIKQLNRWMRPERRRVHPGFWLARAKVEYQPLGVVGIIAPWNYPMYLALGPLAGALAAGNRAMIKPSELTPRTSELLAEMIGKTFDADLVSVHTGGVDVAQAFSGLPFDHLIFTGSTNVGKLVMRAASEHLVPVTLELGGKSPTVIDRGFPMDRVAAPMLIGKLLNSGQTCVAPDYLFVHESQRAELVEAIRKQISVFYPKLADNDDYSGIATPRHRARLESIIADAQTKGAKVVQLNPGDEDDAAMKQKLFPTLILDPKEDMTCLQEELFGPLLPIKTYKDMDEVVGYINDRDRPLALYVFSDDANTRERFTRETHSGALVFNTTILHVAVDDLPFGGVGASGMGAYHGHDGFKTFSHAKPILDQLRPNGTGLMHPPYGQTLRTLLNTLVGK